MRNNMTHYTPDVLRTMPTLCVGQADDLKFEITTEYGRRLRYWLSRLGVDDGMPCNDLVTVEAYHRDEGWRTVELYTFEPRLRIFPRSRV